jgi:hypothetical protein
MALILSSIKQVMNNRHVALNLSEVSSRFIVIIIIIVIYFMYVDLKRVYGFFQPNYVYK